MNEFPHYKMGVLLIINVFEFRFKLWFVNFLLSIYFVDDFSWRKKIDQ